ncbi:MAG: type II toxin-antitoxin system VapC family toxin [bacterium]
MRSYLFDSFALLCWLQEEEGFKLVDRFILDAQAGKVNLYLSIINLGEIYYRIAKVAGLKTARNVLEKIRFLPLRIISASDNLVMKAAELKARYPIAYADAFALATALEHQAVIITGDPEFRVIKEKFEIIWIRSYNE